MVGRSDCIATMRRHATCKHVSTSRESLRQSQGVCSFRDGQTRCFHTQAHTQTWSQQTMCGGQRFSRAYFGSGTTPFRTLCDPGQSDDHNTRCPRGNTPHCFRVALFGTCVCRAGVEGTTKLAPNTADIRIDLTCGLISSRCLLQLDEYY